MLCFYFNQSLVGFLLGALQKNTDEATKANFLLLVILCITKLLLHPTSCCEETIKHQASKNTVYYDDTSMKA